MGGINNKYRLFMKKKKIEKNIEKVKLKKRKKKNILARKVKKYQRI